MFKRYQINLEDIISITNEMAEIYAKIGEDLYTKFNTSYDGDIKEYLDSHQELSAEQIKNDWFPQFNADVFISHAHINEEQALILAGWLYKEFNIISFIDSKLWKYSENLLKKIDNAYTLNEDSKHYDYNKRNFSTAHVHVMLSSALIEMIDSSECLFFINSKESLSLRDELIKNTLSPWIYTELITSEFIRLNIPLRHQIRGGLESYLAEHYIKSISTEDAGLKINYSLLSIMDKIPLLSKDQLNKWKSDNNSSEDSKKNLDNIYKISGAINE
ncbi:hypothetical protein ACIPSG_15725 [Pectobacterium sp. CHL-2024]|uniref:hypothetical protein n=1 Tax=Pectobacterium sp. CHL-2024 TaxID=3377079 RepID=UPI0038018A1B